VFPEPILTIAWRPMLNTSIPSCVRWKAPGIAFSRSTMWSESWSAFIAMRIVAPEPAGAARALPSQ
jgi:hypothetical protein